MIIIIQHTEFGIITFHVAIPRTVIIQICLQSSMTFSDGTNHTFQKYILKSYKAESVFYYN